MLSKEQIQEIKNELIQQIEQNFPEDKKNSAKQQIQAMNNEELEEFLKKNNLIKTGEKDNFLEPKDIFRSIVEGKIPCYKIDENKYAIAILEINPGSKGHTLIIPKKPANSIEQIPQAAFSLAKKISKRLETKLKAKKIEISSNKISGEFIINVLPIYKDESMSKRYRANEKELEEIKSILEKKPRKRIFKKKKPENISNIWIPKRIP